MKTATSDPTPTSQPQTATDTAKHAVTGAGGGFIGESIGQPAVSGGPGRGLSPALKANIWQPGQSGNPRGRLRKTPLTDALLAELGKLGEDGKTTVANILARKLILTATGTGPRAMEAMQMILERAEGKVIQRSELSGVDGSPVQLEALTNRDEVESRIAGLLGGIAQRMEAQPIGHAQVTAGSISASLDESTKRGEVDDAAEPSAIIIEARIAPQPEIVDAPMVPAAKLRSGALEF